MYSVIISTCPLIPLEWVQAHGFTAERIIPSARSFSPLFPLPDGICPYAHAYLHAALARPAEAVLFSTACDQMKRCFELFQNQDQRPAFLFDFPKAVESECAQEMYEYELERLSRFLLRIKKTSIPDRLETDLLEKVRELPDLPSDSKPNATNSGAQGGSPGQGGPKRLAIVGSPIFPEHLSDMTAAIEAQGDQLVLNATESGALGLSSNLSAEAAARDKRAIAAVYLRRPHIAQRPNSAFYEWVRNQLETNRIDAVIFYHHVWCDLWKSEGQRFKNAFNVPVLILSAAPEPGLHAQTRIASFLELIHANS